MKNFCCCLLLCIPIFVFGQQKNYFQQQVDFDIHVTLHPESNTLDGHVQMKYFNNSPDTLKYIWIHLWPNAYKNDATAFSEQLLQNGRTDFYFSDDDKKGYINRLNFEVDGITANLEDHPLYIDVAKLILPAPLDPGDSAVIETPFHEKLPFLWSRSGYKDGFYSITQWYPKPAVYDRNGWHPMPYLDQGEFYSEFGSYTVNISVPKNYSVAATGTGIGEEISGDQKQMQFHEIHIHDFAWFAFKNYTIDSIRVTSIDGHTIKLFTWYDPNGPQVWKKSLSFLEDAIRSREAIIGPYPYHTAGVVQSPQGFNRGMEYPGITNIEPVSDGRQLDELIDHEVGHNWFYAALGTNERLYPWMDEGLNTFYTDRYLKNKYKNTENNSKEFLSKKLPEDPDNFIYRFQVSEKKDQPIATPSAKFSEINYFAIAYYKTSLWLYQLRDFLGADIFDSCMKAYYEKWKFRHPLPQDLKNIISEISGKNVDSIFNLLQVKGDIQAKEPKSLKVAPLFSFRNTDKYNYLFIAPALGYNYYDKLMAGILLHNYTLPEPAFHFILSPMYGTGSKSFTGLGRIGYTFRSYGLIRKLEFALSGATFNVDEYTDSTGKKNFMDFKKIVPSLKVTFRNKDPRSSVNSFLEWKTYFISEESLLFRFDSILMGNVITYPQSDRYLNQLTYTHQNERALYPFSYSFNGQQAKEFVRLSVNANSFFNYKNGGGLHARLFAGKFIYLGDKTIYKQFATDRYHLNLSGPVGYEDYTYSNYFIGRNEFRGLSSQQIMIRDGAFKVKTDLLANKVGKTDNWLAALNLNTDIPKKINPLQVLPFDIGLKAFLDMGTYAEAWQKEAETGKFLYDAGLQLSLVKGLVNIYIPVLYSKVFRDYYKSTIPKNKRFWNTVSFSIDIQKFNLRNFFNY